MGQRRRRKNDGGLYRTVVHAQGEEYPYYVADWKDAEGNRHRTTGASPEQALARKNTKVQALARQVPRRSTRPRKPAGPTVEEAAEMWLAADQRLGDTSRAKYRSNLRMHAFLFIESLPIRNLDVTAISRMTELQRGKESASQPPDILGRPFTSCLLGPYEHTSSLEIL